MKCPACAASELVHDTRNLPYTFDCETTIIPTVVGDYCPACNEGVLDTSESARVIAAMLAFRRFSHMKLGQLKNDPQTGMAGGDAGTLDADDIGAESI